jgi:hypothetical protein
MDVQDIRNLQEAYLEVVENQQLDELDKGTLQSYQSKAKNQVLGSMSKVSDTTVKRVKGLQLAQKRLKDKKYGQQKEQTDLYDIILSHLLDEGYADTQEAAEAIMVNMSEEWRDTIIEEAPERITIGPASPRLMKDAGPARVHNPKKPKKVKKYN